MNKLSMKMQEMIAPRVNNRLMNMRNIEQNIAKQKVAGYKEALKSLRAARNHYMKNRFKIL